MAHFIDTETYEITDNVLVGSRPRFAEFTADGKQLWVTSEVAGTVSVIDAETRKIIKIIEFDIPGVQPDLIQPVGVRVLKDGIEGVRGAWARPITWRSSTPRRSRSRTICLSASGSGSLPSRPDEKLLFATNGNSNDISVIDVPSLKVVKSIPVGTAPWGVAVSQQIERSGQGAAEMPLANDLS